MAAAMLACASAQASMVDWGVDPGTKFAQVSVPSSGAFHDYFLFELTTERTSRSSNVANNNAPNFVISPGATYSLHAFGLDQAFNTGDDQVLATWGFNGTTGSTQNYYNLAAGRYYFSVDGIAAGSGAPCCGKYTLVSSTLAVVPVPPALGLMGAGLAILGAAARRRKAAGATG